MQSHRLKLHPCECSVHSVLNLGKDLNAGSKAIAVVESSVIDTMTYLHLENGRVFYQSASARRLGWKTTGVPEGNLGGSSGHRPLTGAVQRDCWLPLR